MSFAIPGLMDESEPENFLSQLSAASDQSIEAAVPGVPASGTSWKLLFLRGRNRHAVFEDAAGEHVINSPDGCVIRWKPSRALKRGIYTLSVLREGKETARYSVLMPDPPPGECEN